MKDWWTDRYYYTHPSVGHRVYPEDIPTYCDNKTRFRMIHKYYETRPRYYPKDAMTYINMPASAQYSIPRAFNSEKVVGYHDDGYADKQLQFYPFLKPEDPALQHELKGHII